MSLQKNLLIYQINKNIQFSEKIQLHPTLPQNMTSKILILKKKIKQINFSSENKPYPAGLWSWAPDPYLDSILPHVISQKDYQIHRIQKRTYNLEALHELQPAWQFQDDLACFIIPQKPIGRKNKNKKIE